MPIAIAIIGAGPAGCTLARLLLTSAQHQSFEVAVFEAEATPDHRAQGGTLDLHDDTGILALKRAGLFDEFRQHARYDGEAMLMCDEDLTPFVKMGGRADSAKRAKFGGDRPEIDRPLLRKMLVESLPDGVVRWGKKLVRAAGGEQTGRWTLNFTDGSAAGPFDLVVGADGAWSRVRPLLTDAKPYYSGVTGYSYYVHDAARTAPDASLLVNRGNVFCFGPGSFTAVQQMGDGSLNVSTWRVDRDPTPHKDATGSEILKADREMLKDHHPRIRDILDHCDPESATCRPLYMLPVGSRWIHRAGVTLIGDAAHLMTPFAGEGVNTAMKDALGLAEALIAAATTVEKSGAPDRSVVSRHVQRFETDDMFPRAKRIQEITLTSMEYAMFTPGGATKQFENYLYALVKDAAPWWAAPLVKPAINAYFFGFRWWYGKSSDPTIAR